MIHSPRKAQPGSAYPPLSDSPAWGISDTLMLLRACQARGSPSSLIEVYLSHGPMAASKRKPTLREASGNCAEVTCVSDRQLAPADCEMQKSKINKLWNYMESIHQQELAHLILVLALVAYVAYKTSPSSRQAYPISKIIPRQSMASAFDCDISFHDSLYSSSAKTVLLDFNLKSFLSGLNKRVM